MIALPMNTIRISDFTLTLNHDQTQLFVQWQLFPSIIDETFNDEYRRKYFKQNDINGFKISSTSPNQRMTELIDVLQRNYTLEQIVQGEICLYLLKKINYEKHCKQLQLSSTSRSIEQLKSSIIIDRQQEQDRQQQQYHQHSTWHLNEPIRSILIGSIFGVLFVITLLIFVIILITRCPYLLACHMRSSKYHQNNDSKSETLLVRPTPTNTIPWSPPLPSMPIAQQHFYHSHTNSTRPLSYQPSLSTQCTCPTHYHSSNSSSSTEASSHGNPGLNYHIYQEILNDDLNTQNLSHHYRTCRPLHIETNSPPTSIATNNTTNSEQCQICSLSVLV
jgi:hypothetical protein